MGFRYQKRVNLGGGAGLNVSKSGVSGSVRTKHGSIGKSGFSIRTGIPGLTFRSGWGKHGGIVLLVLLLLSFIVLVVINLFRFVFYFIGITYNYFHRRFTRHEKPNPPLP